MNRKRMIPLAVLTAALAACGRSSTGVQENQKNYEVVQEGSASGVTSTIQGPGEMLPANTSTNADTTTAFALDPNAATAFGTVQPGTIAGTLPPLPSYNPPPPMTSATPRPAPSYTPPPPPTTATTQPSTTEPVEEEEPEQPPATTTTVAPPTDTSTATTTPPPPPAKKEEKAKKEEGEPEEEPPPPPPPSY